MSLILVHQNATLQLCLQQFFQIDSSTTAIGAVNIGCDMDSLESEHTTTDAVGLNSKAAKLFYRITGENEELKKFDTLRSKLKSLKQQKKKETTTEKNEYQTLLIKLQNHILSIKYTTKDKLKNMEEQNMATSGELQTDHLNYKNLYK